ncbi:IS3 family transposase [Virgibacillus dokdonensis]|uniref:IS3 family transposase n=1 Tax=Virgibacillus dokdonensis TaxID=302167 RepID=UPI000E2A29F8
MCKQRCNGEFLWYIESRNVLRKKLVCCEELKRRMEEYIYWYNNERSKEKLAG